MASGKHGGRRRWLITVAAVTVAALTAVTGCGGAQYTYVANSDEKTYFRIPSEWKQIDQTSIDNYFMVENPDSAVGQIRKQLQWSAAYDADTVDPSPDHMTKGITSVAPIVYVSVRHLPPSEQSRVSYDFLRDIFTYVTAPARQFAAEKMMADFSTFEILSDEILPVGENGLHGVRTIFNYEFSTGVVHTFDQTAYASADSSTLYLLLIRCTAKCYRERAVEIDDVATSFTVRSSP